MNAELREAVVNAAKNPRAIHLCQVHDTRPHMIVYVTLVVPGVHVAGDIDPAVRSFLAASDTDARIAAAVAAERERCAKLCEEIAETFDGAPDSNARVFTARECAEEIREEPVL